MIPKTFHEIEMAKGIILNSEQSPLSDWYARIRNVPLSTFDIEDLCKSVRQCLYLEYVIPVAVEVFEKNPLAGDMYEGELAVAFRSVPAEFWREYRQLATKLLRIMQAIIPRLVDDVKNDVVAATTHIEAAIK